MLSVRFLCINFSPNLDTGKELVMARRTVLVSDMSGQEIEEGKGAHR